MSEPIRPIDYVGHVPMFAVAAVPTEPRTNEYIRWLELGVKIGWIQSCFDHGSMTYEEFTDALECIRIEVAENAREQP